MASLAAPQDVAQLLIKQQQLLDVSIDEAHKYAVKKHPTLDKAIFTDMAEIYKKTNPEYLTDYMKLSDLEKGSVPPDPVWLNKQLSTLNSDAQLKIIHELIDRHAKRHPELSQEQASADVKIAWDGVAKKYHGPSLTDRVVGAFYDEDKGGIRYGGIVGALLGGIGAFALTGGGGGGIMGIITMVLMTALGAYGGNLAVDEFISPQATPGTSPSPQQGQGKAQEKAQEKGPEKAQEKAEDAGKVPHFIARPDLPLEQQSHIPQDVLDKAKQSQPAIPGMQYVPQLNLNGPEQFSIPGVTPAGAKPQNAPKIP